MSDTLKLTAFRLVADRPLHRYPLPDLCDESVPLAYRAFVMMKWWDWLEIPLGLRKKDRLQDKYTGPLIPLTPLGETQQREVVDFIPHTNEVTIESKD